MKLAALVLASLAALVDARVADACSPAPTCGDELCWGPIAVLDATIVSMPTTQNYRTSILVQVANAWGETNGIPIGGNATLRTTQTFTDQDIGTRYVLYLERDDEGILSILRTVDLADYRTTMCVGADATPETLATVALAPDCYHTLTPSSLLRRTARAVSTATRVARSVERRSPWRSSASCSAAVAASELTCNRTTARRVTRLPCALRPPAS